MKYLCAIIISLTFTFSHGQVTVSGKMIDSKTNEPLAFATGAFQSLTITDRLEGTYSDDKGAFELSLAQDRYTITFQTIGYENFVLSDIEITSTTDLGLIKMKVSKTELEEVVVRAELSYVENDLGKKTLHIGSDLANAGNTALNALESLPSVTTTINGAINVRGSQNVIIYINGRETKRDPKTLQFISADALTKIELITNPSAKYDAEGIAGIINLVYTKSKSTKLDVFASITTPFRGSVGLNASISSDKFALFVNASERRSRYENNDRQFRQTPNDSLVRYENVVTSFAHGLTREVTVGLSYESDTSFSIGFEANYLRWDDEADQDQSNHFSYENGSEESSLIKNDNLEIEDELTFTLSSEKNLSNNGSLKLQLTTGGEDEVNRTRYNLKNMDLTNSPIGQSVNKSDETESQRYYQAKIDYNQSIADKVNLEVGLVSDLYDYNINQSLVFFESVMIDNRFQVLQGKYAGYVLVENKRHRFEYALGIRFEAFKSKSIQKSTDSTFKQHFRNLFPSVQWKYSLGSPSHSIGFNFTRRINRPGFFDVSPFLSYTDPLNLETGNPFLKPEFGYLYELTYSNTVGKLTFDLTAFRRNTRNVIQQFTVPFDEDKLLVSYENLGVRNNDGFELSSSFDMSGKLKVEVASSAYRTVFSESDRTIFYQSRWNWQARVSERLRLEKGWSMDFSQYYRAPRYGIQSVTKEQLYLNASIQKSFSEKRGTVTLSISDIFNNRIFGSEIVGENFALDSRYKFQTQKIRLSLRYKIVQN